MIESAVFHNFKALRHVSFPLERLTVIVGPNASGKTSILSGLNFIPQRESASGSIRLERNELMNRPDAYYSSGADEAMMLDFIINKQTWRMKFYQDSQYQKENNFNHEHYPLENGWMLELFLRFAEDSAGNDLTPLKVTLGDRVGEAGAALLRLDSTRLAAPSYSTQKRPRIDATGTGLASALAFMALSQPEEFQLIKLSLKSIIPIVDNVRFDRALMLANQDRQYEVWGESLIFDFEGSPNIPSAMVSEGTLIVLGLVAILHDRNCPQLVLVDDIDRGLHPKAQKDLIELLRLFLEQNPDIQIVATTHSPYLLDSLKPEEVRLTTLQDDGSVACARMDEHPEFEKWKEAMTPGEFWSLVGEKWVADLRATEKV